MRERYEVAVVGLGIMGSAIAYHLARAGKRVLGVERFEAGHDRGSSSGRTRLFRTAHSEHPGFAAFARRSRELWADAERASGLRLMLDTGVVTVGPEGSAMVRGTIAEAERSGVPHRVLTGRDLGQALPALRLGPNDRGVLEEDAGILLVERCVAAHQELAVRHGAELRFGVPVTRRIEIPGDPCAPLALVLGERTVEADAIVLAAGPWTSSLLPAGRSTPALTVERVPSYFLEPAGDAAAFEYGRFPVVLWDHPRSPFCIFPRIDGDGVKIAFHHDGRGIDPEAIHREPSDEERAAMHAHLASSVPALNGRVLAAKACMYTNTRDGLFAIGPLDDPRLVLVAACSGMGFKFGPAVGEIVADLVARRARPGPSELYDLERPTL